MWGRGWDGVGIRGTGTRFRRVCVCVGGIGEGFRVPLGYFTFLFVSGTVSLLSEEVSGVGNDLGLGSCL